MRILSEEKIEAGPDFNWDDFLKEARQERITPLLFRRFCSEEAQNISIPARIQLSLKDDYYNQLVNNTEILRQFEEFGKIFQKEEIPFIIFKGLSLAGPVYRDLGLRSSHDIDILIKHADIFKANNILEGFGYQSPFKITGKTKFRTNRYRNAILYSNRSKDKVPVHLFWHLLNLLPYHKKVYLDMPKIWQEAVIVQVGDLRVRTLSFNHQVIYLSMHAISHGFFPLTLLFDLKELIFRQEGQIDWKDLVEESFRFGLSKHLYYSLSVARTLTGANVPLEILEKLKPAKFSVFERDFINSALKRKVSTGQEFLAYLGMNECVRDRVKFLVAAFFPAKDELAIIRQKDAAEINFFDYLSRFLSGFRCALKPFPRNNLSK